MDESLSVEAVDNLVTQFSSALDFYRELVQNSIDAGSSAIDVWLEFIEPEDETDPEGSIAIHVDDFGEGMNEEIIDDQLTRLFASSKENDLTKIGKFGIGFVSVFAMKPRAVLLHTGRGGEFWEVLFHEDRSFTKTRLETPVEGTQVTLFVTGDRTRFREIVGGSRTTLKRWCAHSDTEVSFENRSPEGDQLGGVERINEPFAVAGDCMARKEVDGSELVLAYSSAPVYGFYNKGLALALTHTQEILGEYAGRFRHVAFKIKSRYLEHTLSRETVMRDENYHKAMRLLVDAANSSSRAKLADDLEQLAAAPDWSAGQVQRYHRLLSFLVAEPIEATRELSERPILRSVTGNAISLAMLEDCAERDGRVYVAATSSRVSTALEAQGVVVALGQVPPTQQDVGSEIDDPVARLVVQYLADAERRSVIGTIRRLWVNDFQQEALSLIANPEHVVVAATPDDPTPKPAAALLDAAEQVLESIDAGYRRITTGIIESVLPRAPLFVLARKIGPLMALPPHGVFERSLFRRPEVLVNREHAHFVAVMRLHARAPQLAAYCLAKSLLLEEDRMIERDVDLMAAAIGDRIDTSPSP